MIDWDTCDAVERNPLRVSGAWVFRGTRVPVSALFENNEIVFEEIIYKLKNLNRN